MVMGSSEAASFSALVLAWAEIAGKRNVAANAPLMKAKLVELKGLKQCSLG